MNTKHPLLVLVAVSTAVLVVLAEIAALVVIPKSVPPAARFSERFLFVATAIVLFPAYKRLDSLLTADISKASGEDERRELLDKMGKAPLMSLCLFFFPNGEL